MQHLLLTGVSVDPDTLTLVVGAAGAAPTVTVSPADATVKTVSWSSSDTSVATVVANTGVVTAVAVGTATMTVTTADGGQTATVAVTVTYADVTSVRVSGTGGVTTIAKAKNSELQLIATVLPATANQDVVWTVVAITANNNADIATDFTVVGGLLKVTKDGGTTLSTKVSVVATSVGKNSQDTSIVARVEVTTGA